LSWLSFSGRRRPRAELSSARLVAADARLRTRRPGAHARRAPSSGRRALPVLLVRRRDVRHAGRADASAHRGGPRTSGVSMPSAALASDAAARRGRLVSPPGVVETPVFMPVGTYGTVKATTPEEREAIGAHMILGNAFHLMLRPGIEVVRAHG